MKFLDQEINNGVAVDDYQIMEESDTAKTSSPGREIMYSNLLYNYIPTLFISFTNKKYLKFL